MTLEDEIKRVLGELTFANTVLRFQLAELQKKLDDVTPSVSKKPGKKDD